MQLSPFPAPELARFPTEEHHKKALKTLLSESGKEQLAAVGRGAIYAGDLALPTHFHNVTIRMEHATVERSFKRGACLALGLISLDRLIKIDSDSVLEHMLDLNDYRESDESFSSAALRIGFHATYADTVMAKNIFEVGQFFDQADYDPVIMQHGASYMQLIAERHLQKSLTEEKIE